MAHVHRYNWGLTTHVGGMPGGNKPCLPHRAAEFVPMFWGCNGNCTASITAGIRAGWAAAGVAYILGFNEPDNPGQSNLTPENAALHWCQLDDFAQTFDPPLELVGPGMTHWTDDGGSPWLDQFLGNLSSDRQGRIRCVCCVFIAVAIVRMVCCTHTPAHARATPTLSHTRIHARPHARINARTCTRVRTPTNPSTPGFII